ncbi:MAG: tRNA adenosine(34) deaminase TadA [Alteromonadaceae bacterium]|nr:MAG: tRNA adenosine(34) deaminase TadA [Alteromonadaceae bacterium]
MLEDNDTFWMKKALTFAEQAAEVGEVPVGAVLVRDGKLIGAGWNQPISTHDPSAHAEIVALRDAAKNVSNYRLPDATLYVTIEPCTMCFGAMVHARVSRIVFGALEPKAGVLASHPEVLQCDIYNHIPEWDGGICAAECSQMISDFFKKRRAEKKAAKRASQLAVGGNMGDEGIDEK